MPAENLVPLFRVKINGADIPPQAAADLITATVHEDVDAPGMFALQLINYDMGRLEVTWSDDTLFNEGNAVDIKMGYVDNLTTIFKGDITGLEQEFNSDEVPTLTVRGYDRRYRLLRGSKTRSFTQMKDSDIARKIAGEQGLTAKVENSKVNLDYVLQHNQSDMDFLQERARRIGYEVVVEDKTLYFRPRQNTAKKALTLRSMGLIEFYLRSTLLNQLSQVEVRGWDSKKKSEIIGKADKGKIATAMGGSTTGPAAADSAFGKAAGASVNYPVFNQAEADQIALGGINETALAYITGEGLTIGRTDLRAGTVIRIEGLGKRNSGLYYVTSTTHTYTPARGYRTRFSVRRNAA